MNLPNLLHHISLRRLKLQKAQTFMAASGICLGVAAIVSIGTVNKSVLKSFEDSLNRVTGRASLQITAAQSGFPEAMLERVQDVPGVEYAVPVIEADGLLTGGKERSMMIMAVDVLQDNNVRDYSLTDESADIPDPLLFLAKPDSILLTKDMADREGIKIDQRIEVQTVQGIRSFRVRGLLNPEGPAKAMGGNVAFMDVYAAQMAFGKEGKIDRIDVSLLKGEDLETVGGRIQAALPEGYTIETPAGRSRQVELMLAGFQRNISLMSYIAIFVGMYLIYNAVSISVVHRRKEIGILRALGATRGEVIRLFLGETLVTAIFASAVGVGLGILFAGSVMGAFGKVVSAMYARTEVTELSLTWFYPLVGMASGILASLIAALFPAVASSRISPVSAIRSVPYAEEGFLTSRRMNISSALFILVALLLLGLYKYAGSPGLHKSSVLMFSSELMLLLGISLAVPAFLKGFLMVFRQWISPRLGAVGRLSGLNLRKNITRNSVAAAAVFYGIAIFVSTAGFMESTKQSVLTWIDAVVRTDILVSSGHPISSTNAQTVSMPVDLWKNIEQVPGVLSADPFRKIFMDYNGRRILLLMVDVKRRLAYSPFIVARGSREDMLRLLPGQDNVVVSEALAAQFNIKPGDVITLPTPAGKARFGVAAVVVDYHSDTGSLYMDIHTFQRRWDDRLADTFSVRVKPGQDVGAVRDAILKRFGADRKLFALPAKEFKAEIRKVMDDTFIFDYVVNVVTLTIACMGIIVTLLSSVLERTREIGILRSIGMLRTQVSRVVVLESMLMGLAGGLLGAAAGILLGWMSLEGFLRASYGRGAEYYLPGSALVWAIFLSGALAALAGLYPAKRAAKTNITEALSYE